LIGDEVHGLGSGHLRNALIPNVNLRIGLSATPRRWFDDEGTDILINYFGEICFEFSLEKAIGKFLTPYEYYPQLISLTGDELILYEELTEKIKSLSCVKELNYENNERLKMLFLKRSRLLSTAKNKIPALLKILSELLTDFEKKGEAPKGILIYCAPGEHRNVLKEVSKTGLKCHEFVHDVNLHDREEVLSQFENGLIQILVAIKCLDEGVDVPATQAAFILASSTNPREFVQRRGRILRRSKGKVQALIYDFLVAPEYGTIKNENDSYISILKREMPRFVEFSSSASNQFDARSKIRDILDYYHLLNLLDEKPWDVYHSLKEADWSNESEK
jgi:superfamily II DNA or RNA helicase